MPTPFIVDKNKERGGNATMLDQEFFDQVYITVFQDMLKKYPYDRDVYRLARDKAFKVATLALSDRNLESGKAQEWMDAEEW